MDSLLSAVSGRLHAAYEHDYFGNAIGCSVTGFACWVCAYYTGDFLDFAMQPFAYVLRIIMYAICIILFWHLLLLPLIRSETRTGIRGPFFRALDYVWYGAATIAVFLIANELQVTDLKATENSYTTIHLKDANRITAFGGSQKASQLCEYAIANIEVPDARALTITKAKLSKVCESINLRRETDIVPNCRDTFPYLGVEQLVPSLVPKGKEELYKDVKEISQFCFLKVVEEGSGRQLADAHDRIEKLGTLPQQKSTTWLFLLLTVIGLRLTRTTADFIDAWRDRKPKEAASLPGSPK